jgi:hypothetical protein
VWRKIKIAKMEPPQDAYVTIGNGQIHFGITACRLMPECLDMTHVEFFRCDEAHLIGVSVVNEPSDDSVPMQRPQSKSSKHTNNQVNSFTVVSKNAIARVFGEIGESTDSVKCKVSIDPDCHGMFVIDLRNPRKAKNKKGEAKDD